MDIPKPLSLSVAVERWPIAGRFNISRGAKTEAVVVVATLSDGIHRGRGECVPYARYGENVDDVRAALEAVRPIIARGLDRTGLQTAMPPGAARNAVDCALWDLEAKRSGRRVYELAALPAPEPVITAYTISLDEPAAMGRAAEKAAFRPLLKVKLGAAGDPARIAAVRAAAPETTLIVDANEGWTDSNLPENVAACAKAGVKLIEQPLPAGRDLGLTKLTRSVAICADESAHDRASLPALVGKYDAVNIKLDKAGGLTEALAMAAEADRLGLSIMAGCMVATSLSMAPAVLLAQKAAYVDLDGPLLLAADRPQGLRYDETCVFPPAMELWG